MSRTFFAGGTYADATPDGAYAVVVGTHIQTHRGPVDLPPGEDTLLFIRITTVGGFQIAGKSHNAAKTWLWQNGAWRALPDGTGVSPLIFDRLGELHISDGSIGSQGWRYVEDDGTITGRLITGDATYGSTFGLSEWSAYGGLSIGQGHDVGGVCVWDGTTLRLLETGPCTFVRVQGDGQNVAIAFWKMINEGAVVYQTTLNELRALPPVAAPVPVPAPSPAPTTEPKPVSINHLDIVQRVAQSLRPDGTMPGNLHFVQAVLAALPEPTAGYVKAPSGAENTITVNGTTVRTNRVIYPDGSIYKIITDSGPGGANGIAWNYDDLQPSLYLPASALTPAPAEPPAPQPPSVNLVTLQAAIDQLRAKVAALEAKPDPVIPPPAPAPDLSGFAKKGDLVTVRGSVFGYTIVGHGSIDK